MDLQTRKLHYIEEFIQITDEKVIAQLEEFMRNQLKKQPPQSINPMSMDEFLDMIDKAREDVENRRITEHETLKIEIESW